MCKKIYGYVRVSTHEQNVDRQLIEMHKFGIEEKNIFIDRYSGKNFERPAYKKLIKKLKPNDTLVIKSIDRLGRNYLEIPEQWKKITKEKMANIIVLDMPLLDTRRSKDLLGTFISDIVLQILSYTAQTEREFIHQRQAEGIIAAKRRGVKFGRKPLKIPKEFHKVYCEWLKGKYSARYAAKILNVDHHTFLKWANKTK